jgi:penicillin-binding protein A
LPLILVAAGAFAYGIYEAGASGRAEHRLVVNYVEAWQHGNYGEMYSLLSSESRSRYTQAQFTDKYRAAAETTTLASVRDLRVVSIKNHVGSVMVVARTRIFGRISGVLLVPFTGSGGGARVTFAGTLLFPGVRAGEKLRRVDVLGSRGTIVASNGTVLAQGPSRTSPLPAVAGEIVGTLGPIPASQRAQYMSEGYPANAQVGQDGLELVFQKKLAGTPGGTLYAGKRVLAEVAAKNGTTARSTINTGLEEAAIDALGGAYAGMSVLNPSTGALEAAAGIAYNDTQPPGSTMKIVTASAAIQDGLATLNTDYPMQSSAYVGGFKMQNAGGEVCGGTLINAFATSCDTVFAPIGVQLGAARLVNEAKRFGFDQAPSIPGELESTIPSVKNIGSAVSVGSSAIGQGEVSASTLQMADVAAAIADHGRRPIPTYTAGAKPRFVTATTPKVAGDVQQMMEAVVEYGTGTAAQIPGVQIAGKTGTAELADTAGKENDAKETDAWFVAYAPANDPKVVVCALFPNAGYGADTAAPAVRSVLEAALGIS